MVMLPPLWLPVARSLWLPVAKVARWCFVKASGAMFLFSALILPTISTLLGLELEPGGLAGSPSEVEHWDPVDTEVPHYLDILVE